MKSFEARFAPNDIVYVLFSYKFDKNPIIKEQEVTAVIFTETGIEYGFGAGAWDSQLDDIAFPEDVFETEQEARVEAAKRFERYQAETEWASKGYGPYKRYLDGDKI